MFLKVMRKFKLDNKIGFITTSGISAAKRQEKLASNQENILVDMYEDLSDMPTEDGSVSDTDTLVDIEEILCQLELEDNIDIDDDALDIDDIPSTIETDQSGQKGNGQQQQQTGAQQD